MLFTYIRALIKFKFKVMKKNIFLLSALAGMFLLASCGGGTEAVEEAGSTEEATEETAAVEESAEATYTVDVAASKLNWSAKVIGIYGHTGAISISEGSITMSGDQVTSSNFTVDMTTIAPVEDDGSFSEEKPAAHLLGHLSSPDFFDIVNNPTATLTSQGVEGGSAAADLTIKGQTVAVTIESVVVTVDGDNVSVSGSLTFDRQAFGVAWGFPGKDMVLSDEVELTFEVTATK
ncbi:MAG: hypothetical protein COB85_06790 [Bacteroidetes bacterium]|nr:MAG: hypothetical protein COB85_06790 [Bacteroidota bacterium]